MTEQADRTALRDRFVAWGCNMLINHVATPKYRAFIRSVYAAGRPALLWRLKNTRAESDSLGLEYTRQDAADMLIELNAAHGENGATFR
jgi:hypothetical protein